jgi:hypothetical protein
MLALLFECVLNTHSIFVLIVGAPSTHLGDGAPTIVAKIKEVLNAYSKRRARKKDSAQL